MPRADDVARIRQALVAAAEAIRPFVPGEVAFEIKAHRGDPLTEADLAANRALHQILPRDGEGWLSEESVDDPVRLERERVWVVDPIDGTREFVNGVPEWCISVALVAGGRADGTEPRFNAADPRFPNFVAAGPRVSATLIEQWLPVGPSGERT